MALGTSAESGTIAFTVSYKDPPLGIASTIDSNDSIASARSIAELFNITIFKEVGTCAWVLETYPLSIEVCLLLMINSFWFLSSY